MEFSFPHYLLSKQSVDDRALNRHVYERLSASLPSSGRLAVIEVGAGIGTMPVRLLRWGLLRQADYVLVDEMPENIVAVGDWLPRRVADLGLRVERSAAGIRFQDEARDISLSLVQADVFDFIRSKPPPADLLIAHAFLDLLPMPGALRELFSLLKPGGLAWLTINFDGVTTFEPTLEPDLDAHIERLYHDTMDRRPSGGDSRSGRHLFSHIQNAGGRILAAGASDWVVYAQDGKYPDDEAYFLQCILHFFESSLGGHHQLGPAALSNWLAGRRAQLERGELVYLAHQVDFLARVGAP